MKELLLTIGIIILIIAGIGAAISFIGWLTTYNSDERVSMFSDLATFTSGCIAGLFLMGLSSIIARLEEIRDKK